MKRKYNSYKDSGVEWIGVIPDKWFSTSLKRFCIVKRGSSPRPIDDPKYFDESGRYSWVRISDVTKSERYLTETEERLSDLGSSLSTKIYPNDIFLSIAGSVGKPIISKIECCIHDGFVWFENLKIEKEFLYYIFKIGQCFSGLGKMGTQLNLNTDTVGMIEIPVPNNSEQTQIVEYLDKKTSQIDSLIQKTERKIELLKEKRTSLINEVVTKGLNPNVEMKDSGIEWIGKIPKHWSIIKGKYILKILTGNYPPEIVEDKNGVFFTKVDDLNNIEDKYYLGTPNLKISPMDLLPLEEGLILFPKRGMTIFTNKVVITRTKCFIDPNLMGVRVLDNFNRGYLFHLLVNRGLGDICDSSTIPQINNKHIYPLEFCNPPLSEQEEIVKYIDKQTELIDSTISLEERRIELLKEYRQSLISEVVTGKIKVTNDE